MLVWSLLNEAKLSRTAANQINTADEVLVSAVSIYEIDRKRNLHKGGDPSLSRMPLNMPAELPSLGFTLIDVTPEAAWRAAALGIPHRDPWDRFLLAQAMTLGVPLISCDPAFKSGHSVSIIW